jgi:hypothetical protein
LCSKARSVVSTQLSAGLSTGFVDRVHDGVEMACVLANFPECAKVGSARRGMPNQRAKSTDFAGHFFANMAQAPSQQPVRDLHTSLSAGLSTGIVDSAPGLAKKSTNTREALRAKAWSTLSTALPQCLPTGTVE